MTDRRFARRQNPLPEIAAEVEAGTSQIEAEFGEAWLEQGDTPLQALWRRTDWFATTQLHLLGQALLKMARHRSWIREQVAKIKRQEGNRRGAMFELVATPLFSAPGSIVLPTRRDFKGYDATVTFSDGGILDISMKNFGVSVNERQFLAAAKQLEERWLQLMKETGRNGMGLFLLAERPVATSDWSTLQARLWSLVVQQPNPALIKIDGPWVARVHLVPKEIFPIATHPLSYQVTFSVPFHANERQNLLDRVSAGASNARKFARGGVETARVLYIRLHEEAEITAYSEWVADLFCAEPDHPLDAVLLYQPALVQSDASDGESSSSLQHIVVTVGTQRFMSWRTASPARSPQITLPIGTVSDRPARRMLQNDKASVTLPPGYFYQSGDFYSCRPLFGAHHMGMMAPGLRRKFVLQGPEGELMISPISLPDGRFTLFD